MNKQESTKQTYGYGHDFTLFTVGLSKERLPAEVGKLKVRHHGIGVLSDYRGFLSDGTGCLYDVSAENELGGVLFLKTVSKLSAPVFPWMTEEETKNIDVVSVDPAFTESIQALLTLAVKQSPAGKIYVYIRHQSTLEAFNVAGILSVDRFMKEIIGKDRLLSGFVYILSQDAEKDLTALVNDAVKQNG